MKRLFPFAAILAILLGLTLPATVARAQEAEHFETIALADNHDAKAIREVIALSLVKRGWSVKEQDDSHVVGYIKHHSNEAEVTFTFDSKKIEVGCWGYDINSAGVRKKPELPVRWLRNLSKDIRVRLGMSVK